ncbi:MAG: hypothetical protein BGO63_12745 [Candidatus Accumulibacter sp. 66-26]|nr:[NiFe]-hydrogenase assembly chaperone HybE [Accumulibacter sp.]OJW52245.1 MAG: hypothetical protein BGO63_12745 [Candidatus Accumulibacter sp. 66-26]
MNQRLRVPAFRPPLPPPAAAIADDPSQRLEAMYRRIWAAGMCDLPFVNPALAVEALGFRRWQGDWVGALITPWFLNLFILPGGGTLWSELPSGERCKVAFPVGTLEFIADHDAAADAEREIPAYRYCPLFAPVGQFATQDAARGAALAALEVLLAPPPAGESSAGAEAVPALPATPGEGATPLAGGAIGAASVAEAAGERGGPEPRPDSSRRAFFRRVAGR